jgi:tetratricopeptide (TPR) repeat protein
MSMIWKSVFTLLVALCGAAIALTPVGAGSDLEVPDEDALWQAAGDAFAAGHDMSAAMQQYRLFVSTYGKSERAARAQFMLAECYFAVEDYTAALAEYDRVLGRKGRDEYLEASVMLRRGECFYNLGKFDRAIETFDRLIHKHDDTFLLAESLYELGLGYIVQGKWMKLETIYRRLLESRPGYKTLPQVEFALGLFAYHDQRYEEAIAHFETIESDRGRYYLGRCYEDTGQYIRAIQQYKLVLRHDPESPLADDAAYSIAEAFYRSGQNDVAVRSFRQFIELYPESPFLPNARYKMACVTYREGRYDESVRQLQEICRVFSGEVVCAYASYLIGDCYMNLGRPADAIFSYTEVLRGFPESRVASAALHKVVYAYALEKNHAQAIVMAEEFSERFPGDPLEARVMVLEGFCQMQLAEFDAAVRCFQNVLDKHVNTDVAERALFLSTLTYHQQNQLDRLITNYRHIASRLLPTPSHWRARTYYYLGEAYYTQGLHREAEGMYRLVLTGYPRSNVAAPALQGLVASLSKLGETELALKEQETFMLALANADSEGGTNALAVGAIYFNKHQYEEALREYQDFLDKNPTDPKAAAALASMGDCYYRLQYYDQAIATWGDLLARFPAAPEVEEGLYRIADTQFGLGRFEEARATYRRLGSEYAHGAHAADAAFGIANAAYNLGQDEAAITAFNTFIDAYPADPRVEDAELGIQSAYYRSGKDMTDYLASHPDSPLAADVYWTKGQQAFADGRYQAAVAEFEKITLDYPDSESGPGALFYMAESYYRMEELEQAHAGYQNFITTHPEHELAELAHFRAATIRFKMESYEQAARDYATLQALFPAGEYAPLAAFNAAICFQELEDWTAAVDGFEQFVTAYPEHDNAAGLWMEIGAMYHGEIGDYPQAIAAYDAALGRGEAPAVEIEYRKGETYEKARDIDAAMRSYELSASAGAPADQFRIASLVALGEIHESRGSWQTAIDAYQRVVDSGGKPEWIEMAKQRIQAIRDTKIAGR